MNKNERLPIWTKLHADAVQTLAETDQDFPGVDAAIVERIRTGRAQSVKMTSEWLKLYTKED